MTAPTLPRGEPASLGFDVERLARLDAVLDDAIATGQLPGAVVLVARRGEIAHAAARGKLRPDASGAMPLDAVFRIYSMTKPLASVAALMLMEEGRLQLADAVSEHLPEFRTPEVSVPDAGGFTRVPPRREITLHDLLTHSSGLTYGERSSNLPVREAQARAGLDVNPRALAPLAFVAGLAAAPLAHQPGTVWEYGFSTDLLGLVVERIAGRPLGDFLAERIFCPLGMTDSGFQLRADQESRAAEPLARDPIGGETLREPTQTYDARIAPRMHSGGAGALSTAGDYMRFARMLAQGGAFEGRRLLAPASIRLMTSDHLGTRIATPLPPGEAAMNSPGYGFGLGVAVRLADGLATVPGSAGDYFWSGTAGTTFWVDPRLDLVVVFMAQAPGILRLRLRRMIRQLVYAALVD